ncbi:hypothetical protein Btru_000056 [Bulinus truncatus]|nr:hypothetical protein Btru_000056 [Bulinus truncatus]
MECTKWTHGVYTVDNGMYKVDTWSVHSGQWSVHSGHMECTQWTHGVYTVDTWSVHSGHMECTQWTHGMYTVDTWNVHSGHMECTKWTHGMYTVDTQNVHSGHTECTQWTHRITQWTHGMYRVDTWNVHSGHMEYRQWTHGVYTVDTRNVHSGHTECTQWTLRMYTVDTRNVHSGHTECTQWTHRITQWTHGMYRVDTWNNDSGHMRKIVIFTKRGRADMKEKYSLGGRDSRIPLASKQFPANEVGSCQVQHHDARRGLVDETMDLSVCTKLPYGENWRQPDSLCLGSQNSLASHFSGSVEARDSITAATNWLSRWRQFRDNIKAPKMTVTALTLVHLTSGYNSHHINHQWRQSRESSFRHKLDSELHTFQRNIHNFLSEQQTHIQKIYTSAEFPVNLLDQSMNPAGQESPGFEENSDKLYSCCTDVEFSCETKASLMIELLSLSCQLTALLNLPKFSLTET